MNYVRQLWAKSARPNTIPWAALDPGRGEAVERRADAATTVAGTVATAGSQSTILGRVFANTAAAFLNVDMPVVPAGTAAFPVLTDGPDGGQVIKGARRDAEAVTFASEALTPGRATARVVFNVEDASRLVGMDDSLRDDLRGALAEVIDAGKWSRATGRPRMCPVCLLR